MKKLIVLTLALMIVFVGHTNARPGRSKSELLTNEDLDLDYDLADSIKYRQHLGSGRRTRHSPLSSSRLRHIMSTNQLYDNRSYEEIIFKLINIIETYSRKNYYPIIIPYPVIIDTGNTSLIPNINSRLPNVWGITYDSEEDDEDDDGSRPISFKPSKLSPTGGRAPPVEHGTVEGQTDLTTQKPLTEEPKKKPRIPTRCEAAIINCCRFDEPDQKRCFVNLNCSKTYATQKACTPQAINMVIEIFKNAYKPS